MWKIHHVTAAVVVAVVVTSLRLVQDVDGLLLTSVKVPAHPVAGESVSLKCEFNMEGDDLYKVTWYKSDAEFYRYLPKDKPPAQVYEVDGVIVDLSTSDESTVTLEHIGLKSSGVYRCEVSAETPTFVTVSDERDMNVIAIPAEGPKINGGKLKYQVGDTVRVNCTSYRSKPAAMLSWTINGNKAPKEWLKEYQSTPEAEELETSVMGLEFRVREDHFHAGEMKLRCTATIAPIYHQSNEESVSGANQQASVLESKETPSQAVSANRTNRASSITTTSWWTATSASTTAVIIVMLWRLVHG